MGQGRWDSSQWDSYSTTHVKGKSTRQVFSRGSIQSEMDPKNITVRESRDSDDNPNSTALIVALDVSGTMSSVIDSLARKGLNTLCEEVYDRKPITDPHIMCMGVGDADYGMSGSGYGDEAPLQVTQFEADIRIAEQIQQIYLEGNGGGNGFESYHLPWYFAAMNTEIDCYEKRGKKGYLFTIGDEYPPDKLRAASIERVFGTSIRNDISTIDALAMAQEKYHVFHVVIEEGSHARSHSDTKKRWQELLGERVISLADHEKLAEAVVSIIQVTEGANKDDVIDSWDGSTAVVVKQALGSLEETEEVSNGVVEL